MSVQSRIHQSAISNPVESFLNNLGLPQYLDLFVDNHIGPTMLPSISSEDLKEIGIASLGHRKLILMHASKTELLPEPKVEAEESPAIPDETKAEEEACAVGKTFPNNDCMICGEKLNTARKCESNIGSGYICLHHEPVTAPLHICLVCQDDIGFFSSFRMVNYLQGSTLHKGHVHDNCYDSFVESLSSSRSSQLEMKLPTSKPKDERPFSLPSSPQPVQADKQRNGFALWGMIFGFLSIFLWGLGGIPAVALILSSIGLSKAKERGGKGRVQSGFGIALGVSFFFLHLFFRIARSVNG